MMSEDRRVVEISGMLELLLGKPTKFVCAWQCDDSGGFATTENDREILVAWLEQAIEMVRSREIVEIRVQMASLCCGV
jgi:hypothetical protein